MSTEERLRAAGYRSATAEELERLACSTILAAKQAPEESGLEGIEIITKSLAGIERGYIFATDQHRGGFIAAIKEG